MDKSKDHFTKIGVFQERINRFTTLVEIGKRKTKAYLANSGRLKELLVPGNEALLCPNGGKLPYKLIAIKRDNFWVSVDSHLVNKFFLEMYRRGQRVFVAPLKKTSSILFILPRKGE